MRKLIFAILILISIMMEAKVRKPAVAGPIVPIIIATQKLSVLKEIAQTLEPYMNGKNLFVISSDFSHYPAYLDAKWMDGLTKDSIMTGKAESFVNAIVHNQELNIDSLATSACGMAVIATLLMMTEKDPSIHPHHIMYQNSGDSPYGGKDRVVGYHSFVFTQDEDKQDAAATDDTAGFSLSQEDKDALKEIARKTIAAVLEGHAYTPHVLFPGTRKSSWGIAHKTRLESVGMVGRVQNSILTRLLFSKLDAL